VGNEKITVTIDGKDFETEAGTRLDALVKRAAPSNNGPYLGAWVDNTLTELTGQVTRSCSVRFIDIKEKEGNLMYARSLCFVFIRAARGLFPGVRVTIEHSVNGGVYAEIHAPTKQRDIAALEAKMRQIVEEDSAFVRRTVTREEAMALFEKDGQMDKVRLLSYRPFDYFNLYENGGIADYFYGLMVPSTGYLKQFRLFSSYPGVIIYYPRYDRDYAPDKFRREPKLSAVFREAKRWARILNCENVCDLNDLVDSGGISDFIRVNEALHEKKIIEIAENCCKDEGKRLILIAGPSSSGKTTFAQRLTIHLRVLGKRPVSVSVDNYYKCRADIPADEDGKPDLEHLKAIDVEQLNEQLLGLLQGEEVAMQRYDFALGRHVPGRTLRIEPDQPIIVEGIHGLNPDLTPLLPDDMKFRIYVTALTQLNLDDHNRISSTDCRLIRRLVRDSKFRSSSGENTLDMWKSVKKGEKRFIFPFHREADMIFNSMLVYEFAVLKKYALPLINAVDAQSPYFNEAARLRKFLNYFISLKDESDVPTTSILREFIGSSCFIY
jgi:uridine kinase